MWRNGGFWSEKLQRYGTDSRKSGPLTLTVWHGHILHPAGQLLEQKPPWLPSVLSHALTDWWGLPHSLKLSPRLAYKSPHFSAHYCPGSTLKPLKYKDLSYQVAIKCLFLHEALSIEKRTHAQTNTKILSFTHSCFWKIFWTALTFIAWTKNNLIFIVTTFFKVSSTENKVWNDIPWTIKHIH